MSVIPLNTQEILEDIIRLDTPSIEVLVNDLETIIEKRKQSSTKKQEQELINKVHQATTSDDYNRYKVLSQKLRLENISKEEHQELLSLTPKIETSNTERLEHLSTLARLQNTSLREVMEQLGLIVKG